MILIRTDAGPQTPGPMICLAAALAIPLTATIVMAGDAAFDGFQLGATHESGREIAVGDFDGAGNVDIASVDLGFEEPLNRVRIILGQDDGTFGPTTDFLSGSPEFSCRDIDVADFDGDGHPDLVVANGDSNFSVHLGLGDGTFVESQIVELDVSGYDSLGNLEVADLDGDGDDDVIGFPFPGS